MLSRSTDLKCLEYERAASGSVWPCGTECLDSFSCSVRVHNDKTEHRPTGMLWLESANAEWMKNFILEKREK